MRPDTLRHRLRERRPVIGTMLSVARTPEAMLLLAAAGFEFVVIDRQHGPFSDETVSSMICAAKSTLLCSLVRPRGSAPAELAQPLDMGAEGLMAPAINTREEAEAVVRAVRYQPLGQRSISLGQAHTGFRKVDPVEFTAWANRELLVLIQIESAQAVANCQELCSTPGLDGFVVGPGDLSHSLGLIGQPDHPRVEQAICDVLECGRRFGMVCGVYTSSLSVARRRLEQGFDLLIFGSDARLLRTAGETALAQLRGLDHASER
jgi:2-keto-3-deoxy-L-rhamnonate aldolase RhmA